MNHLFTYVCAVVSSLAIVFAVNANVGKWNDWNEREAYFKETHFAVSKNEKSDSCAGTLIDHKEGLIITANHCLDQFRDSHWNKETKEMTFTYNNAVVRQRVGGQVWKWEAEIVAQSKEFDIALLDITMLQYTHNIYK